MDSASSMLAIPRLRLSRGPNAYENAVAGSSRDRSRDSVFIPDVQAHDSDVHDHTDDSEQPTPKMTSSATLTDPAETPAARLRALLARTPTSQSNPIPQQSYTPSDNDSDFDPPDKITRSTPTIARESLKDIFSRALRDTGNTSQREGIRLRRNSIDASEVEPSPRVQKIRVDRKSMSDEEIENFSKSSQRSESSLRSSQATTFDILRERLTNSHTQIKDLHLSGYEHDDSNDMAVFLRNVDPSTSTPPAATSTPQPSLRMSINSQGPSESNLLDHDSDMQRAFEGLNSYEMDTSGRDLVSFPPTSISTSTNHQPQPRSTLPLAYSHRDPLQNVEVEEPQSISQPTNTHPLFGTVSHADNVDRPRDRKRGWNKPRTPTPQTPDMSRQSSHIHFPRGESPVVGISLSESSVPPHNHGGSSRGSSFGSQAEYREGFSDLKVERNIEREREWNKPKSKQSRSMSSLGFHTPPTIERSRTRSLVDTNTSSQIRGSPNLLHRQHPLDHYPRSSSPTSSLGGSNYGKEESEEEVIHERERNWNAPRPKWTYHHQRAHSPLPSQSPGSRVRAESLEDKSTKNKYLPVYHHEPHAESSSPASYQRKGSDESTSPSPTTLPTVSPHNRTHSQKINQPGSTAWSVPITTSGKGKGKALDQGHSRGNISTSTPSSTHNHVSTSTQNSPPSRFSFLRHRTPLAPIDLGEDGTLKKWSNPYGPHPPSPLLNGRPVRTLESTKPSAIPVRSPKNLSSQSGAWPEVVIPDTHTGPTRNQSPATFLTTVTQAAHVRVENGDEQSEASDISQEQTPTLRTIPPPPMQQGSQSSSTPQHKSTSDENRLHQALNAVNTTTSPVLVANLTDQTVFQEISPHPSPAIPLPSHHLHSIPDPVLSTPPRRPSSRSSNFEFRTPSPPQNLPELPGPPFLSSGDEADNISVPIHDLRANLSTIKTPRPPGAWASTPGPRPTRLPSSSGGASDQTAIKLPIPPRDFGADMSVSKTPRPPGAWASTPAPPPPRSSPIPATDNHEEYGESGLATPVPPSSRVLPLSAQTPAPPGAWMITPANGKGIRKVRFDNVDHPNKPEDFYNTSMPTEDHCNGREDHKIGQQDTEATSHKNSSELSTPLPSSSRRLQATSRKSPGIRVLDAFGREIEVGSMVNSRSRNGNVRLVDAMGREVDTPHEASQEADDDCPQPIPPLTRDETLFRVRQGLADLANGLNEMDRRQEDSHVDYGHIQDLHRTSAAARTARMQINQAMSTMHDGNLGNKLGPLGVSMEKTGLLAQSLVSHRWPSSWIIWTVLVTQLIIIAIMYHTTVVQAKNLFLTTYYDPFYPDLHLYISKPDTLRHSMVSSSGSWNSILDTFHREGWRASSQQIWHNLSVVVWAWQQRIWDTLGDGTSYSSTWPPT